MSEPGGAFGEEQGFVVICLMKAGPTLQEVVIRLKSFGYGVFVAQSYPEAVELLVKHKADVFLHDWQYASEQDALHLHLKIVRNSSFNRMARLVLVPEVNSHMIAIGFDYAIDKFVPLEFSGDEIVDLVAEALSGRRESAEFDELIGESLSQEDYDQGTIDERILEVYQKGPSNRRLRMEYSAVLIRKGELDEAERLASALIRENPQDVRAMNLLSRVYLKQKRFDRATQILSQADFLSPQNPERLVMIGDLFYEKGEVDLAETKYEDALDIDPDSKAAHNGLGMVHFSRGDAEKALECFRRCLSEDETASFFNNAAVLAIKSKKTLEALKLYETALRSLQTGKLAHLIFFNIALAFLRIDEKQQAIKSLETALQYDPQYQKARALRDRLLIHGDLKRGAS
jgi:Tfp pilus assembly protein PilF/DNA-binding NarL/FixJ family response regulator